MCPEKALVRMGYARPAGLGRSDRKPDRVAFQRSHTLDAKFRGADSNAPISVARHRLLHRRGRGRLRRDGTWPGAWSERQLQPQIAAWPTSEAKESPWRPPAVVPAPCTV